MFALSSVCGHSGIYSHLVYFPCMCEHVSLFVCIYSVPEACAMLCTMYAVVLGPLIMPRCVTQRSSSSD